MTPFTLMNTVAPDGTEICIELHGGQIRARNVEVIDTGVGSRKSQGPVSESHGPILRLRREER